MLGENGMRWLERLHLQIARELRAKEWSQAEIANILGTTQSTISRQYARPLPELAGTADELMIDGWATEISNALRVYGSDAKLTKQRFVVELAFGPGQILQFNKSLTGVDLESGQKERALLKRLEWAVSRIDPQRIKNWIPAVGSNIASCLEEASDLEDVAAFPGKISVINNKIRHFDTPSFGASSHLASVLLNTKKIDDNANTLINIAAPMNEKGVNMDTIDSFIEELGWSMARIENGNILNTESTHRIDCLLDEGGFAWEPGLYITAHNPLELVDKCHRALNTLEAI